MKEKLEKLIKSGLESLGVAEAKFVVEHPVDTKMGDYSTNAGIKYREQKDELVRYIERHKPAEVQRVELAGPGFINFYLTQKFFADSLKEIVKEGENFGRSKVLRGKKIMLEHTQPNPFKPFHIGHLMNNTIGEAMERILKWNGAEVKTASYHGDIGLHAAKAVWALKKGQDLDTAYPAGTKAYEESAEAKAEIQVINREIYDRSDDEINSIYDQGRKESLKKFEDMYKRLDSRFDYSFFESESGNLGKEIVTKFLKKGIFEESEGAVVFRGEKFGLHTRVFLNSDGLPTYEAKELGLAEIKKETYDFDQSITVTANEQDDFFKVVEVAIGEVYPELKGKLKHLSHGILKLPTGKMSSRTGDVITAGGLIELVKEKVKGDERVAIGAIKYMILRQAIGGDIVFDIEKSVSTEGDSGVYLQYAHARACSVLSKPEVREFIKENEELIETDQHELEKLLYRFPEIIERAYLDYAPHHITTYLTQVAGAFNNFYAHNQIINPNDMSKSSFRLALTKAVEIVLKNGLTILSIPAPERM